MQKDITIRRIIKEENVLAKILIEKIRIDRLSVDTILKKEFR